MINKYSVIVFDLGNVLLPFNYEGTIHSLNEKAPGLGDHFVRYSKENRDILRKYERGDISDVEFLNNILSDLDNKISREEFVNYFSKVFTVNQKLVSLLPKLKEKYTLVLLSNTNSIHREYGWKDYEFLKYFDKLILSYQVNAVKPELKIYKSVEAFTQKPPQEHIFIDDVADYVEGAKKAGWDAVQYTGYDKLIADFKAKNIL
ncbi:MAG: HAD family phosphatase [Ignavibacteriaceae bacterium]